MGAVGLLREDEPLELLDGELIVVSPQGPLHASLLGSIADKLRAAYPDGCHVREDKPLVAGPTGLPEPDVAVVHGGLLAYLEAHPSGTDAVLVVEVAVSSKLLDRSKATDYARAGAPVYWLVDVEGRRLEVHTERVAGGRYAVVTILDETRSVRLPETDVEWGVRELLP